MGRHAENATLFLIILAIFLFFVVIPQFVLKLVIPFWEKRRYMKMELKRSEGEEYRFWKRKLRNHDLAVLPFWGRHIKKVGRKRLKR